MSDKWLEKITKDNTDKVYKIVNRYKKYYEYFKNAIENNNEISAKYKMLYEGKLRELEDMFNKINNKIEKLEYEY